MNVPSIILLNDKEKNYPIIDFPNKFLNKIITDMKKTEKFKKILPNIKNTLQFKDFKVMKDVKSVDILKDRRILVITNKGNNYVYNEDFSLKEEIKYNFYKHIILNNGDILEFSPEILRLTNYGEKIQIIQKFPHKFYEIACECQNFLFLSERKKEYMEVWKYDISKAEYIYDRNITIEEKNNYYFYDSKKNIILLKKNEIMTTSVNLLLIFRIENNNINLIFKCRHNSYFRFLPIVHNKKYIFSFSYHDVNLFSLEKTRFIEISFCPEIGEVKQIFQLLNGHYLIYFEKYYSNNDNKKLVEAILWENKFFVLKTFEFKHEIKILKQLKNGTVIITDEKKDDD